MNNCPNCGANVNSDEAFCRVCGTKIAVPQNNFNNTQQNQEMNNQCGGIMGLFSNFFGIGNLKNSAKNYQTDLIDEDFLFLVKDVLYIRGRGTVVTGIVQSGEVYIGDIINISGGIKTEVKKIEMINELSTIAKTGDVCGIHLNNVVSNTIKRGDCLTKLKIENKNNEQ